MIFISILIFVILVLLFSSIIASYYSYKAFEDKNIQSGLLGIVVNFMLFSFFLFILNNLVEELKAIEIKIQWLEKLIMQGELIIAALAIAKLLIHTLLLFKEHLMKKIPKKHTKSNENGKFNLTYFIKSQFVKIVITILFIFIYVFIMNSNDYEPPGSTGVQLINSLAISVLISRIVYKYFPEIEKEKDKDK